MLMISCLTFSQISYVKTGDPNFKRHFSYSIEGGLVDNLPRQFVAGDKTDWMVNSKEIVGNSFSGALANNGRGGSVNPPLNIVLTDFVVEPGNYQYAKGTGIYFPNGPTGMGYPFLGTYDRRSMQIVSLVYYNLSYPVDVAAKNAAGVRIKYSPREDAYYISGVMVDRPFVDMNFDDIQGRSNGFIMKIDQSNLLQASVVAFSPTPMPAGIPELCSVNDFEINSDESAIYFTGVNTEYNFSGYVQPMVGKIDMDLVLQWCYAYEITDQRYSGIDIEYGFKENSLFVLMNSETTPFSIMQLDLAGNIIQQPESYHFSIPGEQSLEYLSAAARAHILHYTETDGLIVTGNSFILEGHTSYQDLFRYDIPIASDLRSGNTTFDVYSRQLVPLGSQIRVTSWWAPENSIYVGGILSLVGIYNNNNIEFGYSFVYTPGYDKDCFRHGDVLIKDVTIKNQLPKSTYNTVCRRYEIPFNEQQFIVEPVITCASPEEKSGLIPNNTESEVILEYAGIDEGGIHAYLNSQAKTPYQVTVFDITGRKVCSENYTVDGKKYVYLKFQTENQIYMITVNNGIKTETLKVSGVR